jgi:hypothetical protein
VTVGRSPDAVGGSPRVKSPGVESTGILLDAYASKRIIDGRIGFAEHLHRLGREGGGSNDGRKHP